VHERLADQFHVVAPDYPGFGHSDAPSIEAFSYTFDHLADFMEKFTDLLGLDRYGLYMQDFGGPVGFRVASRRPEKVTFLVVQNANPERYPAWQEYFRAHQPPTLIVWGKNDVIFPAAGAHPYQLDLKRVDFNLLDTGHFALEEQGDVIAAHIKRFAATL
jgi:pimeloyl-ACP methyl ester carboxylesterase